MPTQREKIIKKALEILESRPNGIRYSELFREIKNQLPEIPENTIHGTIWDLDKKIREIGKPERGIFVLKKYLKEGIETKLKEVEKTVRGINETIFYNSFANYLVKDLGECTKAIPLGGINLVIGGAPRMSWECINFRKPTRYDRLSKLSALK